MIAAVRNELKNNEALVTCVILDFHCAHALVGKPVSTFPGHAPTNARDSAGK
jgi:hypothetical protein